ncbi:MAG: lipopolysaccharide biosynthesis protein [Cyanobacteriota bacterium]|nr:lipopolysaccharide biosynthesis protein [Cyanobacteriota bacterium]
MSLKQKAVKGVVWSIIQKLGGQTISFIVFSLLARLLDPKDFGLVAMASVYLAFLQVFVDQGFAEAIVQRKNVEREHLDTAFWISVVSSAILMGITMLVADPIAQKFRTPGLTSELAAVIRWLSVGFVFSAFNSVQQALFRRNLAFKSLAVRSLVATLAGGSVGVTMALSGFGVWSLVGQQLVNGTVGIVVLWKASDWRPGFRVSLSHFKDLFGFSASILGFNILNFFNRRADDFLIGYFLGPAALGYYTVAYRILLIVTDLMRTLAKVVLPAFSQLQDEPERLRRAYYKAIQLTSLMAIPTFCGLAVLAPELLPGLFGSQWTDSIRIMQILAFIGIVHALSSISVNTIKAMGKPDWILKVNIINAVLNVTAFVMVVKYGVWAVATAYVIRGYLIPLPIFTLMARKLIHIQIPTYLRQCRSPMLGTMAMVAVMLATKLGLETVLNLHSLLIVSSVLGAIAYLGVIWIIEPPLFPQILGLVKLATSKNKKKLDPQS